MMQNAIGRIVVRKSEKPRHNSPDGVWQAQAHDRQAVYVYRTKELTLPLLRTLT